MCSYVHRGHSHHSEECSLMRWALVHRMQGLGTGHFSESLSQTLTRVPLVSFLGGIFLECSDSHSCPTLWDSVDCSTLGSSVHGILQARTLEWVAIPLSKGSSWPLGRGSYPGLLHCMQILYRLSYREASPCDLRQVTNPLCVCFLTCKMGVIVEGELQGCVKDRWIILHRVSSTGPDTTQGHKVCPYYYWWWWDGVIARHYCYCH